MQEAIDKLSQLRGVLLLRKDGDLEVVSDFTVVKDKPIVKRGWFKDTIEYHTYISSVTTRRNGKAYVREFTHLDVNGALFIFVNAIIEDRNRYKSLLRSLSVFGLTIKRKQSVTNK